MDFSIEQCRAWGDLAGEQSAYLAINTAYFGRPVSFEFAEIVREAGAMMRARRRSGLPPFRLDAEGIKRAHAGDLDSWINRLATRQLSPLMVEAFTLALVEAQIRTWMLLTVEIDAETARMDRILEAAP